MIKPPIKRKIRWLAKGAVASLVGMTPKSGKSAIGSRLVTGMGTGSHIHQMAISAAIAATCLASWGIPDGAGSAMMTRQVNGPSQRPTRCRRPEVFV